MMVKCTYHKGYSLTLYFKSYGREDSKKETEVVMKIIMAISQVTNLFPVAAIPSEYRVGIKRETEEKGALLSFGASFEPEQEHS